MQRLLWLVALLLTLAAVPAGAQPTCTAVNPGSLVCQAQAVNPLLTDIVAGTQAIGPNRTNQSVKLSLSQILGLPGSTQYVPFSGGSLTGKLTTIASAAGTAGLNLPPGAPPTSPADGDIWATSAGAFVRINGATLGPLGAGGGVNTGALNAIGYYATAGNTMSGLAPAANSVLQANGSSVPSFSTTLPAGLTIPTAILQPATYANFAALPVVISANEGQEGFVVNCLNGTESGSGGTGCLYVVNNAGIWTARPSLPTQQITIGGQALYLGQATVNQGTGSKLPTWTGAGVSGNCVSQAAGGALQDAGVACGGGSGGNGTVTAGTINQLAWYSASGTAVAGLAVVNNGILGYNGSGIPSVSTTAPAGLTLPGPTISNPALTGAGTYVGLTGTGKLTAAPSTTTQAGLNVTPGVAPTAPANGDIWSTTTGFFVRYNGGTFPIGTGNGTLTGITTSLPLAGGGTSGSLTLTCPTCLTGTAGGPLIATTPLQFNGATGTVSLGQQTRTFTFDADQYTTVGNASYPIYLSFPYATGAITSVSGLTGGTGSPSFSVTVQVNGVSVPTCSGATIASPTTVSTNCGANSIVRDNPVTLGISSVNGSPSAASVQVTYTVSAS